MANKPKQKPITGELAAPDFDAAIAIYNTEIKPAKEAQKQASKEVTEAWKSAKNDYHIHTAGFRKAMQVSDMEVAEQQAFLRSFFAGLKRRGVSLYADLVDNAEGNSVEDFPVSDRPKIEMMAIN